MKTIAYLRVSTDTQDADAQALGVMQYAESTGQQVDEIVRDTRSGAVSWRIRALGTILETINPGDRLIVAELSRIGRSTLDVLEMLKAYAERGAVVHIAKGGMVVDGSINSKIITTMLALASEIEREFLRARTREGVENARQKGVRLGRPPGPAEKTKLTPRKKEITELLRAGVSRAAIARVTGVHRNTLARFVDRIESDERNSSGGK